MEYDPRLDHRDGADERFVLAADDPPEYSPLGSLARLRRSPRYRRRSPGDVSSHSSGSDPPGSSEIRSIWARIASALPGVAGPREFLLDGHLTRHSRAGLSGNTQGQLGRVFCTEFASKAPCRAWPGHLVPSMLDSSEVQVLYPA
jgi:hypothetical protein